MLCLLCSLFSKRERERERSVWRPRKRRKMKRLRASSSSFLNVMERAGLNLDIFFFWLNRAQWVFS